MYGFLMLFLLVMALRETWRSMQVNRLNRLEGYVKCLMSITITFWLVTQLGDREFTAPMHMANLTALTIATFVSVLGSSLNVWRISQIKPMRPAL